MEKNEGDNLPVSAFLNMEDGTYPVGTSAYEKRGIAVMVPEWQIDKCIQCNQCSYVCPHATIRSFLLNEDEINNSPESFKSKKALGKGLENLNFKIQISPMDCTGCGNCADICPAPGKALIMKPWEEQVDAECENWNYAISLTRKEDLINRNTLKGSQFITPLLEFNGACPGCGETPYIRLLTQLFGERMMIANATGCSSIWAASAPSIAYTKIAKEKGLRWGNSLFEDNAEYGYGMYLAVKYMRDGIRKLMLHYIENSREKSEENDIIKSFNEWINTMDDGSLSKTSSKKVVDSIMQSNAYETDSILKEIIA